MSNFIKNIEKIDGAYLIAEIGINHNGSMNIAKKLIDATNACGWHCAKFQKRNNRELLPEEQYNSPNSWNTAIGSIPVDSISFIEAKDFCNVLNNLYDDYSFYIPTVSLDLSKTLDIEEKDRIIVTSGPFKDFQGEVIEVSGERNKLKALLSIFGRETPVELEFSQINKQN